MFILTRGADENEQVPLGDIERHLKESGLG